MKKELLVKKPITHIVNLEQLGSLSYGITIHMGIIIVWDEDYDPRVLSLIEEQFPYGEIRPKAISEKEGMVSMLWENESDIKFFAGKTYSVCGDSWIAEHYI
jgi:hypothetical protein